MNSPVSGSGTDVRYPIGRPERPDVIGLGDLSAARMEIALLPFRLRSAVAGLAEEQLNTPYREGGWTVRQVVHHVADSHMNAVARFRFALTESEPTIKPYDEGAWAMLVDAAGEAVEPSLLLLEGLHTRWTMLLQSLTAEQWKRAYVHPENGRTLLEEAALLYAWHSRHHVAHVLRLRAARGW